MKTFKFYEYSGFEKDGVLTEDIKDLGLTTAQIKYLKSLSSTVMEGKEVFSFGDDKIKANSIVGVFAFENVQIEILPKLLKYNQDTSSIIKNLMYMLSYTHQLDVDDSGLGILGKANDSFIEAYIGIFATRLNRQLMRNGVPKNYVEESENLNKVRGKINFTKNTVINNFNQAKIFCDYSDFSENNILSKAFKFVSCQLLKITQSSSHYSTLNKCTGMLDNVESAYVSPEAFSRSKLNKKDPNLVGLFNITSMFLSNLRPDFGGKDKKKVFTLLFDMNELFENFVYEVLKRNKTLLKIEVHAQKRKRLVSAEKDFHDGLWKPKLLFDTYTDINIKRENGKPLIIDTKYKRIGPSKAHYGISNSDAYQVLAYAQIHSDIAQNASVALLYPMDSIPIKKEFQLNGSDKTFISWTIDISKDLSLNMKEMIGELEKLINIA